jgi:hypothetical protein
VVVWEKSVTLATLFYLAREDLEEAVVEGAGHFDWCFQSVLL